jgi:hypothetical protein
VNIDFIKGVKWSLEAQVATQSNALNYLVALCWDRALFQASGKWFDGRGFLHC